jgi:archaellum biogenesis protein FlaJ (TadC family)
MKFNLFLFLTILLVLLLGIHSATWLNHLASEHEPNCTCYKTSYDALIMAASFVLSAFLVIISFLAYRRDGRISLLSLSLAYLVLLSHCTLWFIANNFPHSSIVHELFHDMGVVLLVPALALITFAWHKRKQ